MSKAKPSKSDGKPKKVDSFDLDETSIKKAMLRQAIGAFSVEPFHDMLAYILGKRPTPSALQEFANNHPDKWANMVMVFGRLAGYAENLNVNLHDARSYKEMSDAELQVRLASAQSQQALLERRPTPKPNILPNKAPNTPNTIGREPVIDTVRNADGSYVAAKEGNKERGEQP